jgi:hypothetical protein
MGTKHIYTIFLFILFTVSCNRERFILNRNINSQIQNIKEELSSYSKEYPDLQDYYLIILERNDSIIIFLGSYTSTRSVGFLDPFGLFKYKGKKFYLFFANGLKWGNDPTLQVNKPDLVLNDYPIWLIIIKENKHIVKKGVRGYFSPTLPPNGPIPEFSPPVIDSANLK